MNPRMKRVPMSKMLSGMLGRIADKLLPQTSAAAGCGGCEQFPAAGDRRQGQYITCCWDAHCVLRC